MLEHEARHASPALQALEWSPQPPQHPPEEKRMLMLDDAKPDSPILQAGRDPPGFCQKGPAYPATVPGNLPKFATASHVPIHQHLPSTAPSQPATAHYVQNEQHLPAAATKQSATAPAVPFQQHLPAMASASVPNEQHLPAKASIQFASAHVPIQQHLPATATSQPATAASVQIQQRLPATATSQHATVPPVPIQQHLPSMATNHSATAPHDPIQQHLPAMASAPVPSPGQQHLAAMAKRFATAPPVQQQPLPDHVPPAMAKGSSVQQPLQFAPTRQRPAGDHKPTKRTSEKKAKAPTGKRQRGRFEALELQDGRPGASTDGAIDGSPLAGSFADGELAADVPVSSPPAPKLNGASNSTLNANSRSMLQVKDLVVPAVRQRVE